TMEASAAATAAMEASARAGATTKPAAEVSVSNGRAASEPMCAATCVTVAVAARIPVVIAPRVSMVISVGVSTTVPAPIAVSATVAVAAAISPARMSVPAPVVPGAGADEEAAHEPVRPVIAIRRTAVGGVGVVAPFAVRGAVIVRRGHHCRADPHANPHLGIRRRDGSKRKNNKHCHQNPTEFPHSILLVLPLRVFSELAPGVAPVLSTRRRFVASVRDGPHLLKQQFRSFVAVSSKNAPAQPNRQSPTLTPCS